MAKKDTATIKVKDAMANKNIKVVVKTLSIIIFLCIYFLKPPAISLFMAEKRKLSLCQ